MEKAVPMNRAEASGEDCGVKQWRAEVAEAEGERRQQPGGGDAADRGTVGPFAELTEVELQADLEHQQDEANLGQHLHRLRRCRMEHEAEGLGCK